MRALIFLFVTIFTIGLSAQQDPSDSTRCITKQDSLKGKTVYTFSDSMPAFPGGYLEMTNFIQRNIGICSGNCATGTVFISFEIDTAGNHSNYKVVRGIHPALDKDALSVVQRMPQWQPGYCKGSPVTFEIVIPVRYTLQ
jgi:TonB family protein